MLANGSRKTVEWKVSRQFVDSTALPIFFSVLVSLDFVPECTKLCPQGRRSPSATGKEG